MTESALPKRGFELRETPAAIAAPPPSSKDSVGRPAAAPRRRTHNRRDATALRLLPPVVSWIVLIVASVIVLIPVLFLLIGSVTPEAEVSLGQIFPSYLDFGNYGRSWATIGLGPAVLNTLVTAGTAALASVVVGSLAAFPLARYVFRGRTAGLYTIVGLKVVPGVMLLLPMFAVFAGIQSTLRIPVIGTYWSLILTYMTFSLPFTIWLMVTYFRSIPRELEEAAMVDGATPFGAAMRVTFPLAVPGMIVAFVFSLLLGWNDVLFASVLTNNKTQTLAVALQVFLFSQEGAGSPRYAELMAAGVVGGIPVVIIYLTLQRFLIGGLAAGAIK